MRNRDAILARLVADAEHGPLPALMLVLTVLTGVVDAVSILDLGRVFVANMTGNVVFVGFALAGASGFSLAASLSALAGFLVGAAGGGRIADASWAWWPVASSRSCSPPCWRRPSPGRTSTRRRESASPRCWRWR